MKGLSLKVKAYEVVCKEGDPSNDLYFLNSGRLLVCTIKGTQVKAIARIGPGEYLGELSFFDGKSRASYIVALEDSELIQIPKKDLEKSLPRWYMEVNKNLTKKIRLLDHIIQSSNLRRFGSEDQKPLTIEEQRHLFTLLTK